MYLADPTFLSGTNTDAVLLNPGKSGPEAVITSYKATTGTDVTTGIEEAIQKLLQDANVLPERVAGLMIGTTVGRFMMAPESQANWKAFHQCGDRTGFLKARPRGRCSSGCWELLDAYPTLRGFPTSFEEK